MIGVQSVVKLVPFALAILSGVNKGFDKYAGMAEASKIAATDEDLLNMRRAITVVTS